MSMHISITNNGHSINFTPGVPVCRLPATLLWQETVEDGCILNTLPTDKQNLNQAQKHFFRI